MSVQLASPSNSGLIGSDLDSILEQLEALNFERLSLYSPYKKQREFHDAGLTFRERLFMAGNQLGKTVAGSFEGAIHATGLYPENWGGRVWRRPVIGWAAGVTSESTRDNVQRLLLGRPGREGTGAIPKSHILDWTMARGVSDLVDTIIVKNEFGEPSQIALKSYEKGREKWQGETLDWVWFDEEPPQPIYTEGLTRTNATGGIAWTTFTPLLGMSEVVMQFLGGEKTADRHVTTMTIDDAEHYTEEERKRIIASYPKHEREARAKGIPSLGSGRIFPVEEDLISVPAFEIPSHWVQIGGLDFGWDHPTAASKLAWDRDNDCVYVVNTHRLREATPLIHAGTLKAWGDWLPWAWPHDGYQHDKGSGEALAQQYRAQGLKMLTEHAQYEGDRGNGVEAGLMDMLDRMETDRLKVFSHLADWFEEFRLYHRKDGKVVKERDDIMSSTRYALMCLRFAKVVERKQKLPPVQPRIIPNSRRGGAWMAR